MKMPWVLKGFIEPDLKLRKKVFSKLIRDAVIFVEYLPQVRLDQPVKSNFHGVEAPQRARRK